MATVNDAGRDTKLTLALVVSAVVIVTGGGYFLYSWLATPPPTPSQVDINRVSAATQGKGTETPAYRELLSQYNQQGVSAAQKQNSSFIASIPMGSDVVTVPVERQAPVTAPLHSGRAAAAGTSNRGGGHSKQDERREKALDALLAQLMPGAGSAPAPGLTLAHSLGGLRGDGAAVTHYASWRTTLPGAVRLQAASLSTGSLAQVAPVEVVPPYYRGSGVIDVGVDSDNSVTPVLARFVSGPYAGAVLKAPAGAKLAGDGVVIHFTDMAFRGVNYQVNAYALNEDTLQGTVATDVNHRYLSRMVLPALLKGIGGIGEMYAQANTQVVTNGFNAVTTRPQTPDGKAVVGVIAGGTANQAANVLNADAAKLPTTQVRVRKGQVVAIQFMSGVYASNATVPGGGNTAVLPAIPANGTRSSPAMGMTDDDWRAKAQSRIDAQRTQQPPYGDRR